MIIWAIVTATIILRFYPDTVLGRWLNTYMVAVPLKFFAKVERKHFICIFVGLFAMQAFASVGSIDMAFLAAWDVSVYLDVVTAVWIIATVAKTRVVWTYARTTCRHLVQRHIRRAPRAKRSHPLRKSSSKHAHNDDEPRIDVALAA